MGTGLPGYQAGWFRLRNGDRALVYLTDRSKAVYVQTTDGYGVMLSPQSLTSFSRRSTPSLAADEQRAHDRLANRGFPSRSWRRCAPVTQSS